MPRDERYKVLRGPQTHNTTRLIAGVVAGVYIMCGGEAVAADNLPCTTESIQRAVPSNVKLESVEAKSASDRSAAHCSVVGVVNEGSPVRFNLGLPQKWNGKFLFLGQGAFAGGLAALDQGLARGYATASTDTGHQAHSRGAGWALNDPQAVTNHYLRGTRRAIETSKGITNAYFASMPSHSYFSGCSGGGRQGLIEATRFTGDFDGIVSAAPAWNYTKLFMTFTENARTILKSPANWISPQKMQAIDRAVLAQCDASDGVVDGMVADPRRCKFDAAKMMCQSGEDGPNCLTKAQADTLERIRHPSFAKSGSGYYGFHLTGSDKFDGGRGWPGAIFGMFPPTLDKSGKLAFQAEVASDKIDNNSMPYTYFLQREFLRYIVFNDAGYDSRTFDLATDGPKLEEQFGKLVNVDNLDLTGYVGNGGKLLIWHGWADDAIPAEMSIDLYERISAATKMLPGGQSIDQSVRLFMVPGVNHCSNGSGLTDFDALGALEKWVENGEAPAQITATQTDGAIKRTRPLCPYPLVAQYRGSGDDKLAANFVCAAPPK